MRTDTQVNRQPCLIIHYSVVETWIGISSVEFIVLINKLEAGMTSGVIREFNSNTSMANVVKKGQNVIRRRALAIFLDYIPIEIRNSIIKSKFTLI